MQVVTKDGNYNAVLTIQLAIDLMAGKETETLVDIFVGGNKVVSGHKVVAIQSNVRSWPDAMAENKAENFPVYLLLDTQENALPDTISGGVPYHNVVETLVSDSNYPFTIKVVPTQAGKNVMVSGITVTEINKVSGVSDSGEVVSVTELTDITIQNPPGTDEFVWVTVVNPDTWEYTITK